MMDIWLGYLFEMLGVVGVLVRVGMLALLAGMTLAVLAIPTGVLLWWAGWNRHSGNETAAVDDHAIVPSAPAAGFVVYLSGIGDVSGEWSNQYEDGFLQALSARRPDMVIIGDVFAFSVANRGLTSEPMLGWFWRWAHDQRVTGGRFHRLGHTLILTRNVLNVAVSADRRYGPIYNYGTAEAIIQSLLRHGYQPGSGTPITLLGYSGGGQTAIAASGYLSDALGAPVQIISLGGVMNDHPALRKISGLYHLYGSNDTVQRLGDMLFPSRWAIRRRSAWNQAVGAGKIQRMCLGPMSHSGRLSYYDAAATLADGTSHMDHTANVVAELVGAVGLAAPAQPGVQALAHAHA